MKNLFGIFPIPLYATFAFLSCTEPQLADGDKKNTIGTTTLWYCQPAENWMEALPLGNGRLGAMVFGGVNRERLQLNEESLWSGEPRDTNNPQALEYLPKVRQLLFAGKSIEATKLADKHLMGVPCRIKPYQSLGDLWINFGDIGHIADYCRELDLDAGIVRTSFRADDSFYTRETFISAPDQVLVMRLSCNKPKRINTTISITREQDAESKTLGKDRLVMFGRVDGGEGMKFEAHLLAIPKGGTIKTDIDRLVIEGADQVTLLIAAATGYHGDDPEQICRQHLTAAKKTYKKLYQSHIKEHRELFRRVSLKLGKSEKENLPTDERLEAVKRGDIDPGLEALYFQ